MTMMTLTALRDSAPLLIKAAQAQLDEWQQDEDGIDEVLGAGGCCGLIADAMSGELSSLGFDTARMGTDFEGGHEFVVVNTTGGCSSSTSPRAFTRLGRGTSGPNARGSCSRRMTSCWTESRDR